MNPVLEAALEAAHAAPVAERGDLWRLGDHRKLTPALTAKERAILVLRAWKEGMPEDPQIRHKMPSEQGPEFNRYISLTNGVNEFLVVYVVLLDRSQAHLDARRARLLILHL